MSNYEKKHRTSCDVNFTPFCSSLFKFNKVFEEKLEFYDSIIRFCPNFID